VNRPLTPDELREATFRIEQGILSAREADLLRQTLNSQLQLIDRERDLATRELTLERERTSLANQAAAIQKDRADFYEQAFKTVSKTTSSWCKVARVFTMGLAKCGR